MTEQAQRIAIAEACGWRRPACDRIGGCLKEIGARSGLVWSCKCDKDEHASPDYLHDLNAMHEAEKVLTNNQRRAYMQCLVQVHPLHYNPTHIANEDTWMCIFFLVNATAAQRAEAFLRCLGKWEAA